MSDLPTARTLGGLVKNLARTGGAAEAVVGGQERLTYSRLWERTEELARGLVSLGVTAGDRVACWAPNQVEWVLANLATTAIGGIFVALNTWYRSHELSHVLRHAGVKAIMLTDSFDRNECYEVLGSVVPELQTLATGTPLRAESVPSLRWVITIEDHARPGALALADVIDRGYGVSQREFLGAIAAVTGSHPADLLYTSGSTAEPKGVVLVHEHLIENGFHIGRRLGVSESDRIWLGNPLFFSYGCANALMVSLAHGATLVLQRVFDAGEALRLMEAERCSVLYGSTNMILAMLAHPERPGRDLSSLRKGTGIGTPADMRKRLDLGVTKICNAYGLTETYGHCCESDSSDLEEVRLNASGRPLPGNEIRIADPTSGEETEPGKTGEILVRGRVTPGYYNDPERNAAAFTRDGFLRTGDLGFIDPDGQLHWQARLTEMIKTGGINVAPSEVEQVLGKHPAVETACVVGLPDPVLGEIVAAAVCPRAGTVVAPDELRTYCRQRLAGYKAPRCLFFIDRKELPLTPTGKVWRKEMRRKLLQRSSVAGERT